LFTTGQAHSGCAGTHSGQVFVELVGDYAFQPHVAIIHNDVDRRHSLHAYRVKFPSP